MCHRCETRASVPLETTRRPRDTPIWKLEAALKCRSCRKGRYAPPVHMIKLTESLGNTLRIIRPVIVMDEGHRAYSATARQTLAGFNPRFLLELSATPDRTLSNILVNVSGT